MIRLGDITSFLAGKGDGIKLVLLVAFLAFSAEFYFKEGDLKDKGPDRDALLERLRLGGSLRLLYIHIVTRILDKTDRFLGDANQTSALLPFPLPFGITRNFPYWTASSFDRCALIAVLYPFVTIYLTWVWSGETDEIGRLLGLRGPLLDEQRWASAGFVGLMILCTIRLRRATGWRTALWWVTTVLASTGAVTLAGDLILSGIGTLIGCATAMIAAGAFSGASAIIIVFVGAISLISAAIAWVIVYFNLFVADIIVGMLSSKAQAVVAVTASIPPISFFRAAIGFKHTLSGISAKNFYFMVPTIFAIVIFFAVARDQSWCRDRSSSCPRP